VSALLAGYRALPRAGRWLVWAALLLALYFAAIEPAVDRAARLNRTADAAGAALVSYEQGRNAREQQQAAIKRGLRLFGAVDLPADAAERSVAFNRRIAEVLEKQGIKGHSTTTRTAPLNAGGGDGVAPGGQRVERLVKELQFDATPEQLSAVLAQLEQSPEVASVSKVQVKRAPEGQPHSAGPRALRASLTVECLVLARKERAR
jgi:hypothetical protein